MVTVITTTSGSRYELDEVNSRIRCANRAIPGTEDPAGTWLELGQHGPIEPGNVFRFFAKVAVDGVSKLNLVTTTAVKSVQICQPVSA